METTNANILDYKIELTPIGTIYTPFFKLDDMPVQPIGAKGVKGEIKILPKFTEGLKDLEGFSNIILIYYFHKAAKSSLIVKPFIDNKEHGVFATRVPVRPNAIGFSIVKLNSIEGNSLYIEEVDILNETPLLDIKPFFGKYDNRETERNGWLGEVAHLNITEVRSDKRFTNPNY